MSMVTGGANSHGRGVVPAGTVPGPLGAFRQPPLFLSQLWHASRLMPGAWASRTLLSNVFTGEKKISQLLSLGGTEL